MLEHDARSARIRRSFLRNKLAKPAAIPCGSLDSTPWMLNLSDASDFLLVKANRSEIRFDVLARATTALQEYHLLPHCLESNTAVR